MKHDVWRDESIDGGSNNENVILWLTGATLNSQNLIPAIILLIPEILCILETSY